MGDRLIHEYILFLYFSDMNETVLAESIRSKLAQFMAICRANDKMDGTRTVDTAIELYSKGLGQSVQEIKKATNLSDASLYRFRIRMADKLNAFLKIDSNEVDNIFALINSEN